jgi:hypothetical protein
LAQSGDDYDLSHFKTETQMTEFILAANPDVIDNTSKQRKVALDFSNVTIDDNQELAIMPSWLAVKLLKQMVLTQVSNEKIVYAHIDDLRNNAGDLGKCVEISTQFVQIRQLITNVADENWDAYRIS